MMIGGIFSSGILAEDSATDDDEYLAKSQHDIEQEFNKHTMYTNDVVGPVDDDVVSSQRSLEQDFSTRKLDDKSVIEDESDRRRMFFTSKSTVLFYSMTKHEVRRSIGEPTQIVSQEGRESWYYPVIHRHGEPDLERVYLVFEGEKLAELRTSGKNIQ